MKPILPGAESSSKLCTQEAGDKNEKYKSAVLTQRGSKQDVTASPKKVPSHMANTDKNYRLIYVIRVYKKPELIDQSVYN